MDHNPEKLFSNIVICEGTADDVEAITKLHALSWVETYVNEENGITKEWVEKRMATRLTDEAIEARKKKINDNVGNPDNSLFVAKDQNGNVLGFIVPTRSKSGEQNVSGLYVDSEYHGRGVAQMLMDKLIEWADPTKPIYLGVATYNERAKAFYKKYGFKEIAGSEELFDGVIPEIKMVKDGTNEV